MLQFIQYEKFGGYMRRALNLFLVIFIIVAIAILGVSVAMHFSKEKKINFTNYDVNLVEKASIDSLSGAVGESAVISFEEETKINTLALSEKGQNIKEFEISYLDNKTNQIVFIYKQDVIEDYRYCCFDIIDTKKIEVKITKTKENANWELSKIDGYLMGNTRANQKINVTAYIPTNHLGRPLYKEHFECITNVNLLGSTNFDQNGDIFWPTSYDENGNVVDGKTAFKRTLKEVRDVIKPGTTVVATFLGIVEGFNQVDIHNGAMRTEPNKTKLINSIIDICEEYNLDGIAFDYEHPRALTEADDWTVFFDFVRDLRIELHKRLGKEKTISAAIASWAITIFLNFDHSTLIDTIDNIEVMSYDNFDHNGAHSAFLNDCYNIVKAINFYNNLMDNEPTSPMYTDTKICNLGLPFYSRPTNGAAYWGNYNSVAKQLGKFGNLIESEVYNGQDMGPNYYNSWQMIYDKTCYWLDQGFGGLMVWHYYCDVEPSNPLSLWGAMNAAIKSRT